MTSWSTVDGPLTVNLVTFSPSSYRFRVRVISASGATLVVRIDREQTFNVVIAASDPSFWSVSNDYEFQVRISGGLHPVTFQPADGGVIDFDHFDVLSVPAAT